MEMHRSPTTSPPGEVLIRQRQRAGSAVRGLVLSLALATIGFSSVAHAAQAQAQSAAAAQHPSRAYWVDIKSSQVASRGTQVSVRATKYRAATLDRASMAGLLAAAPMEFTNAKPLTISLPDPKGGFQRFAVVESPVMEAGLAAKHPDIKTYSGRGIDDPGANLRMDLTPLGFHASVRSGKGNWYIDPHFHLDQSLYSSYFLSDVAKPASRAGDTVISEGQLQLARTQYRSSDMVRLSGMGFAPGANVVVTVKGPGDVNARQTVYATASPEGGLSVSLKADPYKTLGDYTISATDGRTSASTGYRVVGNAVPLDATAGPTLRTYRLALVTDPSYTTYFGGAANVTPAKVTLVNRVTQMYEYDTSIRLVLVANNDRLNFDTSAAFTGANGACGGAACYTATSCTSAVLSRNTAVIGLLIGAGNYDIGHIAFGPAGDGGGVANLGVVGLASKGGGCTGLNPPVGDGFAIDYVAHEMGHQFAAPHTFNGVAGSCSGGNRSAGASVEPGSGITIMAYAGICTATDNLQAHSDPYWSFQSFETITGHVTAAEQTLSETQTAALTGYTGAQLFQVRYAGSDSVTIGATGAQPYTAAGIKAAIEGIAGWPAGGTVTVASVTNNGFTVTFGGSLASTDVPGLVLFGFTDGAIGYINDTVKGGTTTRRGFTQTATGNNAPVVTTAGATFTIPVRTPFALTGSAVDPDGDVVTYLWEQTDRGAAAGTSLASNAKTNGPLFRVFGVRAIVGPTETAQYNSPGENLVDTNPTRVFPDMAQILANNTNAETGLCAVAGGTPTATEIDCFSEFLPTAAYLGFAGVNAEPSLNFRLTGRDGKGGIGNATTKLLLAPTAGPFLVTSPNTAVTLDGFSSQAVTWSVAGTDAAPVSTSNVKITLSTDGGVTFPVVLAASVPNNGSRAVQLPNINSSTARIKVEAVGNVFFDVSNANFTIRLTGDVNGDGAVNCTDLAIIRAAFGSRTFDPRADVNGDGVVDIRDLTYVAQRVTVGTRCQ